MMLATVGAVPVRPGVRPGRRPLVSLPPYETNDSFVPRRNTESALIAREGVGGTRSSDGWFW